LRAAGVSDSAISLLCAVGLHRASTQSEKRAKLGGSIVDRFRVIDHNARDKRNLVQVDYAEDGTPFLVNKLAYDADLLIATGVVEPHQYAGYSGGAKTVTIGCGGEETVATTHGPSMLGRPGVRLGRVEGNPFQEAVRHVAAQSGLDFVLNVVQDGKRRVLNVAAGAPAAVHDYLVGCARRVFEVPVRRQYDLAVAGVGAPKDANLYQASRAITYLQLASTPAVRPGGVLILPVPCPEGAGQGIGEQRFLAALRDAPDVGSMLEEMRASGYQPGAQRAFALGQVLAQNEVIVVGAQNPGLISDCKMIAAATMEEAFSISVRRLGIQIEALVVPHTLQTVVRVEDQDK
jgi:nickel-dependent lactate racemase